jgi:hypothetical protein
VGSLRVVIIVVVVVRLRRRELISVVEGLVNFVTFVAL